MNENLNNRININIPIVAPSIGSIDAYIYWISSIPVLTASEELELANKLYIYGDLEAARKLILSHLRFVVHVAKGYLGYGLPKSDLIQEGTIGLMKAVKRFNPNKGVRLVTFAIHWIKAEIHEFVLRNWKIVKIATTKAQRKLFFNLRSASKKLSWFNNAEIMSIAKELDVNPKEVRAMEARMKNMDIALDHYSDEDSSDILDKSIGVLSPIDYLIADTKNPADEVADDEFDDLKISNLNSILSNLDQRSREILEQRWLKEPRVTLQELADKYGVSAERIRQVEENALKKLRKDLAILGR